MFNVSKAENKYDAAIRASYIICYAAGFIIFFAVGLDSMELKTWIIAFPCCTFGATVYGTIAKMVINAIRKDKIESKADTLIKLCHIVFFAIATAAFLASGFTYGGLKYWIIAFVGSYGGAVICSAIAQVVVSFLRKD